MWYFWVHLGVFGVKLPAWIGVACFGRWLEVAFSSKGGGDARLADFGAALVRFAVETARK